MAQEGLDGQNAVELSAVEGPGGLLWTDGDGFEMKIIKDPETEIWSVKEGEWQGVEMSFETDDLDNVVALKFDNEFYIKRQPACNPPHPAHWATVTGTMNCNGHISGEVDFTSTETFHPLIKDIVAAEKYIEDRTGILNCPIVWSVTDKGLHVYWRRQSFKDGGKSAEDIAKKLHKGKTNVYYAKKHVQGDDVFGRYVNGKDQIIASPVLFLKSSWTLRDGKTKKRSFCDGGEIIRTKKGEIEAYQYDGKVFKKVEGHEMEEDVGGGGGCCIIS